MINFNLLTHISLIHQLVIFSCMRHMYTFEKTVHLNKIKKLFVNNKKYQLDLPLNMF